jgi:hypothetical protein
MKQWKARIFQPRWTPAIKSIQDAVENGPIHGEWSSLSKQDGKCYAVLLNKTQRGSLVGIDKQFSTLFSTRTNAFEKDHSARVQIILRDLFINTYKRTSLGLVQKDRITLAILPKNDLDTRRVVLFLRKAFVLVENRVENVDKSLKMDQTEGVMLEVDNVTQNYSIIARSCSAVFAVLEPRILPRDSLRACKRRFSSCRR